MNLNYYKNLGLALATVAGLGAFTAQAQTTAGGDAEANTVTVDGKLYILGENMVSNPKFTEGLTGWTYATPSENGLTYTELSSDNFKVEEGAGPDGSNALVLIGDGAGSNKPTSIRMPYEATAGKTYYISFDYKNCGNYTTIYNVSSKDNSAKDGDESAEETYLFRAATSDSWKTAELILTIESPKTWIIFNSAWMTKDKSSLTNFFIGEATAATPREQLKSKINDAKSLLEESSKNTEAFGFSKGALTAFDNAIKAAVEVYDNNSSTDEQLSTALETLINAENTFKGSPRILPKKCDFAAGQKMYVKNVSSGLWYDINWVDGSRQLMLNDGAASPDRQLTFTTPEGAAEGQYNIVSGEDMVLYLSSGDNTWSLYAKSKESALEELTDAHYLFTIETVEGKQYLKNVSSGKYLAYDGAWAWAPVYGDKDNQERAEVEFYSLEADITETGINIAPLNEQIKTAEDIVANATAGDEPGQYPQDAIDALKQAIADAKTVAENAESTQEEVDLAQATLAKAIETFRATENKPSTGDLVQATDFAEDTYYYIRNEWSGLWYTASDNDNKTLALDELKREKNQQFKFMYVKNADGNNLITSDNRIIRQSSWNLNWETYVSGEDYNVSGCLFKVEREGDTYYVKSIGAQGYVAPDDNKAGSSLYSNKAIDFVDNQGVCKLPVTLWIAAGAEDAVEGIAMENTPAVYYDLNGRQVSADSLAKGIYVRLQGGKATKILVK